MPLWLILAIPIVFVLSMIIGILIQEKREGIYGEL